MLDNIINKGTKNKRRQMGVGKPKARISHNTRKLKQYKHMSVKKKHLTTGTRTVKITKVINMDEILKQALLYDFYGELLNDHQKEIYEQFVLEDLSLSEIAQDAGISRQGVHDLVKRCQKSLEGYEAKLHLVEKFLKIKEDIQQIHGMLEAYDRKEQPVSEMIEKIRNISDRIIEEL